jgi:hypothetical protein
MKEALTWYRRAADQGNLSAQGALRAVATPAHPPCDLAQIHPEGWVQYARPELIFSLPPQGKAQEVDSKPVTGPLPLGRNFQFLGNGLAVKISHDATAETNDDLISYGGGDAQFRLTPADDGSGSMSVTWLDVGRGGFTVNLSIDYPNRESQQMACAIIGNARLQDTLANLTVVNIKSGGPKPYALVRNIYGNKRKIYMHDTMTRDFGRLEAISQKDVTIIEIHPNGTGGWRERLVHVPLARASRTEVN